MTAHDAAADPDVSPNAVLRELFARQEDERKRVARAIHNELGQAVSAIKMSAHLAIDEADAAQRADDLREIVRIADDTVARLRDLYSVLRPPQIDALGLDASLRGEAEAWRMRWDVAVEIESDALEPRPEAALELAAFRWVQDLLAPHASMTRLSIHARIDGNALRVTVEHDGAQPDALTIALLRARTETYGGETRVIAHDTGAVEIAGRWPLAAHGARA